jgi:probable HAF family extracellular repeat protein
MHTEIAGGVLGRYWGGLVSLALSVAIPNAAFAGTQYTITPLPGIGNNSTQALAINNNSDVVGAAFTGQLIDPVDWRIPVYNPYLWKNGQAIPLAASASLPGNENLTISFGYGGNGRAVNINDNGQILVTSSGWSQFGGQSASLYQNGTFQPIGSDGASALNQKGEVVGQQELGNPFVWKNGLKVPLPAYANLGWTSIHPYATNDNGWIVGRSVTPSSGQWGRAFVNLPGSNPQDIGTLGYLWASANAINNRGEVVGGSWTTFEQYSMHAFLWTQSGGMKDLGTLGGETTATSINESGHVVGYGDTAPQGPKHAFLYKDGSLIDLNSLIDPQSGWVLTQAADINDRGQIVGTGLFNGQERGFVLDPAQFAAAPEPSTLLPLSLGILALLTRRGHAPTRRT